MHGQRPSWGISIHALLAESDPPRVIREPATTGFLSTLSLRRATPEKSESLTTYLDFYPRSPCGERQAANGFANAPPEISIHALLAESDANWFDLWGWAEYFYPRSPCGERQARLDSRQQPAGISIYALLAESDRGRSSVSFILN